MKTTLLLAFNETIELHLKTAVVRNVADMAIRQPIHTVYGGAHLFNKDTAAKLGRVAVRALTENASGPEEFASVLGINSSIAEAVYLRVTEKLAREAVEDLRVDFEDGYGTRTKAEEDGHAISAAAEMAAAMEAGTLPPFIGIRIKSFSTEAHRRAIRTLDLFLTELATRTSGKLPPNFVVTLPKVESPAQVTALADILDELEVSLGLLHNAVRIEIMVETPQAIIAADGRSALLEMAAAARGRCRGAHFGAYDYTASLGITSAHQRLEHQACDFARNMMQAALAGTGVWLSDGATNIMPVGPHRGDELSPNQRDENRETVHRAWRIHYDHCRRSLANGFYQGWDLHPAQLPTRFAAVYAMFLEEMEPAGRRLRSFIDKAAKASLVGDQFDDAATGQGLLNFFVRAVNCGALTESEAAIQTGLTMERLRSRSFALITGADSDRAPLI
ncbi:MAG: aldolase/citrate lyase family protein [Acidobacteriota bacterium]